MKFSMLELEKNLSMLELEKNLSMLELEKKFSQEIRTLEKKIYQVNLIILQKDLAASEKSRMQQQGLMTSRGVTEQILSKIGRNIYPKQKRTTPTDVLNYLADVNSGKVTSTDDYEVLRIVDIFKKCGFSTKKDFEDLYSKLSKEIHGYPWSGDSVKIYVNDLGEKNSCIVKELCKLLFLETDNLV
jgi:hypothetical protein